MKSFINTATTALIFSHPSVVSATSLQDLKHLDNTISASIDGWPTSDGLDQNAQTLSTLLHAGLSEEIVTSSRLSKQQRLALAALFFERKFAGDPGQPNLRDLAVYRMGSPGLPH